MSPDAPRLLLVDDDPSLLRALARVCGERFDVVHALSVPQAIERLREEGPRPVELVLCDLHMPDATGHDLFRWIREHRPALLPHVAFMSGDADGDEGQRLAEDSGRPLWQKPLAMRTLVDRLSALGRGERVASTEP